MITLFRGRAICHSMPVCWSPTTALSPASSLLCHAAKDSDRFDQERRWIDWLQSPQLGFKRALCESDTRGLHWRSTPHCNQVRQRRAVTLSLLFLGPIAGLSEMNPLSGFHVGDHCRVQEIDSAPSHRQQERNTRYIQQPCWAGCQGLSLGL